MSKKSFVFYHDQMQAIKNLPPDMFKSIVLAIGEYSETGVLPELDPAMNALFAIFKSTIDRDLEKYERTCKRNRENGKKRKSHSKPVGSSGSQATPEQAKRADSDSDSDIKKNKERKVYTNDFEKFWKAYPKKTGKGGASKSWNNIKARPDVEELINAVNSQANSEQWKKENGQFIPNPQTWLNQRRWEDEEFKPVTQEIDVLEGYAL